MGRPASLLAVLALLAWPALAQEAPRSPTPNAFTIGARITEVTRGLQHPWGLAFLPDGRLLVTERPGRLRVVTREGNLSEPLAGVPEVFARGQGGLLDVTLSPSFARDLFAEPGEGGAGTAVLRGRLGERALDSTEVIWRQQPKVSGPNHWGSRLVFRPDGTLFVTLGDRYAPRDRAQDLTVTIGKIVRINPDGSIPRDNPFVGATALVRRSGRTATAISRARLWTPPASCGRWNTVRSAAMSSTTSSPGVTTAGR